MARKKTAVIAAWAALLCMCSDDPADSDGDAQIDGDADAHSDGDADTDSDADVDADADSDSDGDSDGDVGRSGDPVLLFSDLTSGPKTGLGDGLGDGAIVTLWGRNLGTEQGSSTIVCGGAEASHVYFWGNADGAGGAGPADLWTSHRMQAVVFSVAADADDGPGVIEVTVGDRASNTLPFTVRAGGIYFVSSDGDDEQGDGSWDDPWETMSFVAQGGAGETIVIGDTVYVRDGVVQTDGLAVGQWNREMDGTPELPIWLVAYPGASVTIRDGIGNYNADTEGWCFAKLTITTARGGVGGFKHMRAVGNEVTNNPGECADGMSGAFYTPGYGSPGGADVGSGITILGNYIHDYGCDTTSKLHHTTYMTNRSAVIREGYELGWNHLLDNMTHGGLHNYDEGICGGFSTTIRIHDNVVVNQVGPCADFGSGGATDVCYAMDVEFFNNLLINCGLEVSGCENGGGHTTAVAFGGGNNLANIRFYNNTIYGYGAGWPEGSGRAVRATHGGSLDWVNNIVVDTEDLPFDGDSTSALSAAANLWYGGPDSNPSELPDWDAHATTADPLFVDAESMDFHLQEGSPAIEQGSPDVSDVVERDLDGTPRGQAPDIGAFEHVSDDSQRL